MTVWIDDELHSELIGEFPTLEDALEELRRLASTPWDQDPNRAPSTSRRTCGRNYTIVEKEATLSRSDKKPRVPTLEIDASGTRWLIEMPRTPDMGGDEHFSE